MLVESFVQNFLKASRVTENLETILANIAQYGLPAELKSRLEKKCAAMLARADAVYFAGGSGQDLHAFADAALAKQEQEGGTEALLEAHRTMIPWQADLDEIRKVSRDLANKIYYRQKERDRDKVEAAARAHPLVRSWEGLSPREAVERICGSRLNKFLNRQANHLEILLQRTCIQTRPSRITLEPTSACNYRCTMCP